MKQTTVFVSSTCYDLMQERADLERAITSLGHTAFLSERGTFPVAPDLDALANCKRVVRDSDILVLIIGGCRGSLDPRTGKPVVNIEYHAAVEAQLPVFVFVHQPVSDMLPIWKRNPQADFAPSVDYPDVFEFVERVQQEKWVFTFRDANEIAEILKVQLSMLLCDILAKTKRPSTDPRFSSETVGIQELVRDRPPYWEYILAASLLHSRLASSRRGFEQLDKGTYFYRVSNLESFDECCDWIARQCSHMTDIFRALTPLISVDIGQAFGEPGQPGDAEAILTTVDQIGHLGQQLLEWEVETRRTVFPEQLDHVRQRMVGWGKAYFMQVVELPAFLDGVLAETDPQGVRAFEIVFDAPEGGEQLVDELAQALADGPMLG